MQHNLTHCLSQRCGDRVTEVRAETSSLVTRVALSALIFARPPVYLKALPSPVSICVRSEARTATTHRAQGEGGTQDVPASCLGCRRLRSILKFGDFCYNLLRICSTPTLNRSRRVPGRTKIASLRRPSRGLLEERELADPAGEQTDLSVSCSEDDLSRRSVVTGDNTYRLVSVVSHLGGPTHSGHCVSDVYSVDRDQWFHYDDRRVSCVDEADVLGESHQRSGHIFFYLHKYLYNQVE